MNLRSVREQFLGRVESAGLSVASLTPAAGVPLMVRFYRDARVSRCPPDEDGDILSFQWGVYDWGDGERFELSITRELMTAEGDGDGDVRQLSVSFRYPPDAALRALGDGEEACDDPDDADEFLAYVEAGKPFQAVAGRAPEAVELAFGEV